MSKKYAFSELCEHFPVLEPAQLKELADDIKEHGLRQPILLLDGKILDGRNRYLACRMAKVEPQFKNFRGDANALVASLNIHRRHLDESQRAMLAADLANLRRGEKAGNGEGVTEEDAARAMKVSTGSVKRARRVKQRGSEKLQKAVRKGKVRVSAAAQLTRLPKEEQEKILRRGSKAVKSAARDIRAPAQARGGLAADQRVMKENFGIAKKKMLSAFDEWRDKLLEETPRTVEDVLISCRELIEVTLTL
jgi:ParB-like chromosome segregation protein Spo0J